MAVGAVRHGLRQMLKFLSFKGKEMDEHGRASEIRMKMASVRDNIFSRILSPVESYVVSLQSLLIWERPYLSAVALVAINCMFWLLASCSRRIYSFVAIIALIVFVYQTWVQQIWPEIRVPPPEGEEEMEGWTPVHPRVLSVPELCLYLNNVWKAVRARCVQLWELREMQHGAFCFIVCSILTVLAVIGRIVPGVVIIYTLVMTVALGPGVVLYVIPTSWYNCFQSFVAMFGNDDVDGRADRMQQECSDSELEEYLPDPSTENLADLSLSEHRAGKLETEQVANDDSMSLPEFPEASVARELGMESLISEEEEAALGHGLENFPDAEEESNDNDDDIGMPSLPLPQPSDNAMFFVPTHFKEESSESESEEAFAQGLSFKGILEGGGGEPPGEVRMLVSQRPLLTGRPHDTRQTSGRSTVLDTTGTDSPQRQSSRASDVDMNEYEIVSDAELQS